ncbi:MAG: hypothetical protein KGJ01_02785, partial [Patescibacteria group bacterium]|nr:hypothetical protein [Patescibacteria group bacterium]
ESDKYQQTAANSGNPDPTTYAIGSNLSITPFIHGLVGYWPLNEGSGTTAYDNSGWNTPLTVSLGGGLTYWTSGISGSAIAYSTSSPTNCVSSAGYVYTSSVPSVITNLPSGNFSVSLWLMNSSAGVVHLNTSYYSPPSGSVGLWWDGVNIYIPNSAQQPSHISYTAPANGSWNFFTYDFNLATGESQLYINGTLVGSASLSGSYGTISNIGIGMYEPSCIDSGAGDYFNDVRIYGRVLTAAQAEAIYNAEKPQ